MPTSTTAAPGLTMSAVTSPGRPAAAITMSARRGCPVALRPRGLDQLGAGGGGRPRGEGAEAALGAVGGLAVAARRAAGVAPAQPGASPGPRARPRGGGPPPLEVRLDLGRGHLP